MLSTTGFTAGMIEEGYSLTRDEAIKQLDWYFNEDDGIAADDKTHAAYATLRLIAFSYGGCGTKKKDSMIICPTFGKIASWNSYFESYICPVCGWEGDTHQE